MAALLEKKSLKISWRYLFLVSVGFLTSVVIVLLSVVYSPSNSYHRDVNEGVTTVARLSDDIRKLVQDNGIPQDSLITSIEMEGVSQGRIVNSVTGESYSIKLNNSEASISVEGTVDDFTITYVSNVRVYYYGGIDVILLQSSEK